MSLDPRITSAAGDLLKNPAFRAICERLEERYTNEWRKTEIAQSDLRERAYQRLRSLTDFLQDLRRIWEEAEAEKMVAAKKDKAASLDL